MYDLKVNILYRFTDLPYGGGNQFLKALREEFINLKVYTEEIKDADIILFNSHHFLNDVLKLRMIYPGKVFIHRIDGPIGLIRNDRKTDKLIFDINNLVADVTVFQSYWSKKKNKDIGFKTKSPVEVIINATNKDIFQTRKNKSLNKSRVKLIAISWSSNWKKGFQYYKWLDDNLDFSRYYFTFIGNSPVTFKNIKYIKPVGSKVLAEILSENDIFLNFSESDPCSNSLIEALQIGLPSIVLNDGGHPEIVKEGGIVIDKMEEIIPAINDICNNYEYYKRKIKIPDIKEVALKYYGFFKKTQKNNTGNFIKILIYYIKLKLYGFYYCVRKKSGKVKRQFCSK